MLKDASNANNGHAATGEMKRSKSVVRIVCVRTTPTTLTTAVRSISNVFTYLFIYWF